MHGKNIFMLSMAKFASGIESTMFTMAKHLARNNRVFYIENPYTWKNFVLKNEWTEIKRRRDYFSFGSDKVIDTDNENLKILVTPPLMSINWLPEGRLYRTALKWNENIILHRIKQIIQKYKISEYIFINSFNFYYPGLGRLLAPDLLVYHCVDPLVFPVDRKHGVLSERRLVRESDLVICTSKRLYDEKRRENKSTFFIPNAADIEHSCKALQRDLPVHEYLKNVKGPIVGYFGNIERRLDYELLRAVTTNNPEISFVFVGPVSKEFVPEWFYRQPNILLPGPVPYDQMPSVVKGFDVAIIPFKKDEVSATIFPLKLFEYLGAGKPVVATDFNPDLAEFTENSVAYCGTPASFSASLLEALYNDRDDLKEQRLEIARQNTWEKRCDEFAALINSFISKGREASIEQPNILQ